MNTDMNEYTIYCTAEQTKKALELGAPIDYYCDEFDNSVFIEKEKYAEIPTAEQMIGWLEEQKLTFRIYEKLTHSWHYFVGYKIYREAVKDFDNVDSRKEATLAAIDAALDFLIKSKK